MHTGIRRYVRHGTLTQLLVLDAIVRCGSYTRAARELHMAQPTVSIHMKKLAETIGAPLVDVGSKGVRLTARGEKVHAAARDILAVLHELRSDLGTMPINCEEWIPPLPPSSSGQIGTA